MRLPAGVGERPCRGAGAMEGVLYKWTNYLSGEWRVLCLSGRGRCGDVPVGSESPPLLTPPRLVRTRRVS